jgi:CheY-like chemotaxis protein
MVVATRVLVVDDDPDIQEYLSVLLEDHAYQVARAGEVAAALRTLEEGGVDLLIVDVLLQGRSGLDLLITLRKDPRWSELPVIVLTGNDGVLLDQGRSYLGHHGQGLRGADAVLGKPLDPELLLSTLERFRRAA